MSALFEDVWSGSQIEELCVEEGAGDQRCGAGAGAGAAGAGGFELEPEPEPEKISPAPAPTCNRPKTGRGVRNAESARDDAECRAATGSEKVILLEPEWSWSGAGAGVL